MPDSAAARRFTYDAYLALERATNTRCEFLAGVVSRLRPPTPRTSRLVANVTSQVGTGLGKGPFQVRAGARLRVVANGFATYPDLCVFRGAPTPHPEDPDAVTDPVAIFDVLTDRLYPWDGDPSAPHESYDIDVPRSDFTHWRAIPTLRHYVAVHPDEPLLEYEQRGDDGNWWHSDHSPGDDLTLGTLVAMGRVAMPDLAFTLQVEKLYRKLGGPSPARL